MLHKPIYHDQTGMYVLDLELEDYTAHQRKTIQDQVSERIIKQYGREPFREYQNSIIGYVLLPTPSELDMGMRDVIVHLV